MRQRLIRFMYGRNGPDDMFRFINYLAIAILLISMFIGPGLREAGYVLGIAVMGYAYFRCFSKNLEARRRENAGFLRQKQRAREWFRLRRDIWKQRKEFKFFKCPSCKTVLRVPVGKGRIRVLCKKCGTAFEKKT